MDSLTVSGPGVDRPVGSAGVGLSLATTHANRASIRREEASFYVRDRDGVVVGRADSDGQGGVQVFGHLSLGAAAPAPETRSPSAPASEGPSPEVPLAGRRSRESSRSEPKEEEMAASATRRRATKKTTAAPQKQKEKQGEKGVDLLATLMHQVEEKVGAVERVPNKSETYTRLQVAGKTFAYVFPPRKSGLAVKIPKQLLEIEATLPSGHGFRRVGWGLTRTITKASEAPKTAAALAVAAAAVKGGGE